ncbi:hypothetical protein JCM9279_006363 [Rhodotorula babjevae]
MASLLPATLDEHTVPDLISTLDRALYPEPTPGFTARTAILLALTSSTIILALLYLYLHYRSSAEGARCLWFIRLVDRPSGRFIVLNPRMAWVATVLLYSSFELVLLVVFWRTYELERGQEAWLAVRSFNPTVFALGGWIISWAGLTAFLVAVDSERQCVSARTANFLFLAGGALLVGVQTALATAATVLLERFWDRYLALRLVLVELDRILDGRAPTLLDFIPLREPGEAFSAAAGPARTASIVQFSLSIIFPVSVLAVNFGGLALVRRLRRQLRESAELGACSGINVELDRSAMVIDSGGLGARTAQPLEVESPTSSGSGARDPRRTVSGAEDIEGTAMPAQYVYDITIVVSLLYLLYNQLSSRRRLSDLETVVDLEKGDVTNAVAPPKIALDLPSATRTPQRSCAFDSTRSATLGRDQVEVDLPARDGLGEDLLELGAGDDDGVRAPPASPSAADVVRRSHLRKKSWASPRCVMASLLPATLDERTVPDLIENLDRAFYPTPSSGFTARMVILEGLTLLCVILVVFYLWLHYQSSTEEPKHRSLWLMRFVDRPSGRFLLINPRPAWSYTILFYTSFNIAFLAICWAVYARGIDQRAWIAMRAFNPLLLFLAGWSFTFANLQAFFVAIESERVFVSARTANTLFIGGGAFIIVLELAVAIDATVFAELLWDRYLELRGSLVALETALKGRVPTLVDFIPIAAPGEAFATAAEAARVHTIVQFSIVAIMPTATITSISTAFMAVSLVGVAIWFACASATGALSSGKWVFVEGVVLPAQWLYTVAILVANVYMFYNALYSRRQLTDLATTAAPSECAGALVVAHPPPRTCGERQRFKDAGSSREEASSQAEPLTKSEAGSAAADNDSRPFFSREPLLFSERPALLRRMSSRSLWSATSSEGGIGENHVWRTRPIPPALSSHGGGAIMVTVETVVVSSGVDEEDEEEANWAEADEDVARLPASLERRGG